MKFNIRPVARKDILQQYPEIGSPKVLLNRVLTGLRSWPVQGFPVIRIYYLVTEQTLVIVRVLHGKRDIYGLLEAESPEFES